VTYFTNKEQFVDKEVYPFNVISALINKKNIMQKSKHIQAGPMQHITIYTDALTLTGEPPILFVSHDTAEGSETG